MRIVQRIDCREEHFNLLLESLEKHPECFNEVWLNTAYGYPSFEVHKQTAHRYSEIASVLRSKGICVSMQLSNTIGHGQYMMTLDCSGLVYKNSPVRKLVGHNGAESEYSFCWNDNNFINYLTEHVEYYVKCVKPAIFWIDDDLRAVNHLPVVYGCFCDDCLKEFNAQNGTSFSREELVNEYLHGDIKIREKFINFVRSGIGNLTRAISETVHKACPDTVVAFQCGYNGVYTGYGYNFVLDEMYKATGHAPMYRAGGGAYCDHNPNAIMHKVFEAAWQHSKLPEYVTGLCPEIENLPNTSTGKTMQGTALETALNLANGATDISYAMLGSVPEDFSFYQKGFKLFSEQKPYYELLSEISKRSKNGGISYAHSKVPHLRKISDNCSMDDFSHEYFHGAHDLIRNALPIDFTERENGVYLLHPETAKQMSENELAELCGKNLITDLETVLYLKSIGIDLGIDGTMCNEFESLTACEIFTDHPINKIGREKFSSSIFVSGLTNHGMITKIPDNSIILGKYAINFKDARRTDIKDAPFGYTSIITETPKGGKWAIMGYSLWKSTVPTYQRNRILNIIDYVSDKALAARMDSPYQQMLMPRICKKTGKTLAVSMLNCTIETQTDIKLTIRRPEASLFTFCSQYDGEFNLPYEKNGDEYTVTIPKISPWSVATVFCSTPSPNKQN